MKKSDWHILNVTKLFVLFWRDHHFPNTVYRLISRHVKYISGLCAAFHPVCSVKNRCTTGNIAGATALARAVEELMMFYTSDGLEMNHINPKLLWNKLYIKRACDAGFTFKALSRWGRALGWGNGMKSCPASAAAVSWVWYLTSAASLDQPSGPH